MTYCLKSESMSLLQQVVKRSTKRLSPSQLEQVTWKPLGRYFFLPPNRNCKGEHLRSQVLSSYILKGNVFHNLILESHLLLQRYCRPHRLEEHERTLSPGSQLWHTLHSAQRKEKFLVAMWSQSRHFAVSPALSSCALTSVSNFPFSDKLRQGEGKKVKCSTGHTHRKYVANSIITQGA